MKAVLTTAHGNRSVLKFEEDFDDPVAAADEAVIGEKGAHSERMVPVFTYFTYSEK